MRHGASEEQIENVVEVVKKKGRQPHVSNGDMHTVIGAVGANAIDPRDFELLDGVKEVLKISSSYKLVSRIFKPEDTVIEVNGEKFGGGNVGLIAGPCTVESEEQMEACAEKLSSYGVKILRGGASSPAHPPMLFKALAKKV